MVKSLIHYRQKDRVENLIGTACDYLKSRDQKCVEYGKGIVATLFYLELITEKDMQFSENMKGAK